MVQSTSSHKRELSGAADLDRAGYRTLVYYDRVDCAGGHYAAWEQLSLFAEKVRAGFRPLRGT
jgi:hypothetical protein